MGGSSGLGPQCADLGPQLLIIAGEPRPVPAVHHPHRSDDLRRHLPNLPGGADVRGPPVVSQRDRLVEVAHHPNELVQHRR